MMKAKVYGLLASVVGLVMLAMPMTALAHDHDGWHHDHGHHYGWYKHHHDDGWWYKHHRYNPYGYGYGYGAYPPVVTGPPITEVPPIATVPPWQSGYYNYNPYYPMSYNNARNAAKLSQLQQTMAQRANANGALYQAALAQGNYPLANKAATRMQYATATANAANSMLTGAPVTAAPVTGATVPVTNPYYGQAGYSPLSSVIQMLGY
ncbi:MAG TPA: hypothetical protein VKB84_07380 [Candidatus Binataceae bacterium]|jgi:hypothetical protein|nr:hypothetical protein [Candidatus Binataceae bacterium]